MATKQNQPSDVSAKNQPPEQINSPAPQPPVTAPIHYYVFSLILLFSPFSLPVFLSPLACPLSPLSARLLMSTTELSCAGGPDLSSRMFAPSGHTNIDQTDPMSPQTSNTVTLVTLQEESQVAFHTCHPTIVFAAAVSIFQQHLMLSPASQTARVRAPVQHVARLPINPCKCIQKKPQSGCGVSKCCWVLRSHSLAFDP